MMKLHGQLPRKNNESMLGLLLEQKKKVKLFSLSEDRGESEMLWNSWERMQMLM